MIINIIKLPIRFALNKIRTFKIERQILQRLRYQQLQNNGFEYDSFKESMLRFIFSLKVGDGFEFKYSAICNKPTLYASAYACMTYSLLGKLNELSDENKLQWLAYFDRFQSENDGLFYDPVVDSEFYRATDWWGSRHLALHMISAYTDLGGKPKHPFYFLEKYYDINKIKQWLDGFDWSKSFTHANDIDNKIMNIGCLLQYQRDVWNDDRAGAAVAYLQQYLLDKINPETGMWGLFDVENPDQRSRVVQFAYHLFPLFFYDHIPIRQVDKVVHFVLATQNKFGGFGVKLNSSACEDIDSIDILVRLAPFVPSRKAEIDAALKKALTWVLCNQVNDAGFVFRLYEPFVYGHMETSSKANEGAMLPTWFRTLSLAYLMKYFLIPSGFVITRCPSYEF